MTKFNLEQALQGAPVRLNNGTKAYVFKDVSGFATDDAFPLIGGFYLDIQVFFDNSTHKTFQELRWNKQGNCDRSELCKIAGMWED